MWRLRSSGIGRWRALQERESRQWSGRAQFAASVLGDVSGVADMGCGLMTLERYLAPGTRYVPVDMVRRDDRTVVCDFDTTPPPETGMPTAACLGLLGYLRNPAAFMAALARMHETAFVTYKASDAINARKFLRPPGYRSHHSSKELSALFEAAGWQIDQIYRVENPGQIMWLLRTRIR